MPKRRLRRNQLFVALAGLIAVLLGAGLANAGVQGALVDAIGQAQDLVAPVVDETEDSGSDELVVAGQLEADHAAPAIAEDEAKLEDEPEDVEEEPEEPAGDPEPDDADDDTTAAVPAPDDDTYDDTDGGKTSIPLPGADEDTDTDDPDTDDADDAADAEDADTEVDDDVGEDD